MKRSLVVSLPFSVALHAIALVSVLVLLREDTHDRVLFVDLTETAPALRPSIGRNPEPVRPKAPRPAVRRESNTRERDEPPANEPRETPVSAIVPVTSTTAPPDREPASPLPALPQAVVPPRDEVVPPSPVNVAGARAPEPEAHARREDHVRASSAPRPGPVTASHEDSGARPTDRPSAPIESGGGASGSRVSDASTPSSSTAAGAFEPAAEAGRAAGSSSRGRGAPTGGDREGQGAGEGRGREQAGPASVPGSPVSAAAPAPGHASDGEYLGYLGLVRRRLQETLRYPSAARRRSLSGTVHLEILVRPDGTIGDATVVASSSHQVLDEAALEAIRRLPRVPFPEGLAPRALRARLPVVFELR